MLLTGALLVVTTETTVSNKSFELEKRLKLKVDEVGLLLRLWYEYNSVCLLRVIAFLQELEH